ncbi:MAG: PD-(D/E)XK nuclease family protein [Myxococcales bacterium]|nr:MAG: PD-(D/E)XK nuclease family protein [Myxococcales bacterium]
MPLSFFLYALQAIRPRMAIEKSSYLNPLERGSLIHEVHYRFLSTLRQDGKLPLQAEQFSSIQSTLDAVLDSVQAEYQTRCLPVSDYLWKQQISSFRVDLHFWLHSLFRQQAWVPVFFELSFGLYPRAAQDEHSSASPVALPSGLQLRGSIDLVEQNAEGALRAVDYKTGKAQSKEGLIIGGGQILQPVLYALALEQLFKDKKVEEGVLYYSTFRGRFTQHAVKTTRLARDYAHLLSQSLDHALSEGFFVAAPEKGACRFCDYQTLCGQDEEWRTNELRDKKALLTLQRLRQTP